MFAYTSVHARSFGSVAFIRGITIVEENEYGLLPQGGQVNRVEVKQSQSDCSSCSRLNHVVFFLFSAGWLRWAMDHSRAIREERHTLLDFATKHWRCLQIHQFIVLCFSSSFHGDLLTKRKHFNRNSIYCTYHSLSVWQCSCKSSWQFCCLSTSQSKLQEQIGNLWALLAPPPWLAIDSHQPK